jgi:hypothetical protein
MKQAPGDLAGPIPGKIIEDGTACKQLIGRHIALHGAGHTSAPELFIRLYLSRSQM